jgi:putative endonuclease
MRRPWYDRTFYVYILASWNRRIYTGVTNNLAHRINQHAWGEGSAFAHKYKTFHLVHYEVFHEVRAAIAREKQIKGWRREKKIALIEESNPTWDNLRGPWSKY